MPNFYKTSTIREVRSNVDRYPNFLRDMYFPNVETTDEEDIILEISKGGNRIAPFVSPVEDGRVMKDKGRNTNIITAPNIAPKYVLTPKDLFERAVGANFQGGDTPAVRQAKKIGKILKQQEKYITNKEEYMIGQFLTTGKITSLEGEHAYELDYQLENQDTLETAKKWNTTGVDIFQSIRDYVDEAEANSGEKVDVVVLGSRAAKALLSSSNADAKLDIKNKTEAVITVIKKYPGISWLGKLDSAIDIYSYNQILVDEKGVKKEIIPANIMIGGPAGGTIVYAPVVYFDKDNGGVEVFVENRHSRVSVSETGKEKSISTEARPVLQPFDLDAYFSVFVCD